MGIITVSISAAILCFSGQCHPALVGKATPLGTYDIIERYTSTPGYGGNVLQFKHDSTGVYAIHSVWLLNPKERRLERLQSNNPKDRNSITHGCINVAPDVYKEIKDADKVEIDP